MDLTCCHEGCVKLFEFECVNALDLRSQADTTKDSRIKLQFTKAGLATVIENFRREMKTNCGAEDFALKLAIEYAIGIMNQIPE
jgi:hypothetical protein